MSRLYTARSAQPSALASSFVVIMSSALKVAHATHAIFRAGEIQGDTSVVNDLEFHCLPVNVDPCADPILVGAQLAQLLQIPPSKGGSQFPLGGELTKFAVAIDIGNQKVDVYRFPVSAVQ